MDLSLSLFIAASFSILCTFYIGKRILTVDFSEYSSENSKKPNLKDCLQKGHSPSEFKNPKDIRNAFERILIPLGKADKDLLPARMDMAFRKKSSVKSTDLTKISFAEKFTLRMLFPSLKMTLKHGAMTAENGVNRF